LLLFQFVRFSVDFAGSRAFVVRGNGGGGCKEASPLQKYLPVVPSDRENC